MIRWKDGQRRAVALIQAEGKPNAGTVWYWLVKSVHQRQDRSLLPTDEEYRLAALEGVRDFLDRVV
jgi:hypothetical protein